MFSSVRGIASRVGVLAIHGLPDDYWNDFGSAVREVTAADVQRVAVKYLDPKRLTLVLVGPKDVVEPQLGSAPVGKLEVQRVREPNLPRKPRPTPPPRVPAATGTAP
jgi:hypothetical protein